MDIFGPLAVVLAAAVTGWFALRAQTQKSGTEKNTTRIEEVGTSATEAFALVREVLAENRDLRARLDDCRASLAARG